MRIAARSIADNADQLTLLRHSSPSIAWFSAAQAKYPDVNAKKITAAVFIPRIPAGSA